MGNKVLFHKICTIDVWISFASSNCATRSQSRLIFPTEGTVYFLLLFLSILTPFAHYYYTAASIFNDWTFHLCITILFNEFVRWSRSIQVLNWGKIVLWCNRFWSKSNLHLHCGRNHFKNHICSTNYTQSLNAHYFINVAYMKNTSFRFVQIKPTIPRIICQGTRTCCATMLTIHKLNRCLFTFYGEAMCGEFHSSCHPCNERECAKNVPDIVRNKNESNGKSSK